VARVTIRRALESLAIRGPDRAHARARHGAGVAPGPGGRRRGLPVRAPLDGLLENIVTMGLRTSVRVVECQTVGRRRSGRARARDIAPVTHRVQKAVRVRSDAGRPAVAHHHPRGFPSWLAAGFGVANSRASRSSCCSRKSGVRHRRRDADDQRAAGRCERGHPLLDVAVGSALLAVNRLVLDDRDRPVQWLHGLYRPDRYRYEMQLSRVGGLDAKVWVSRESLAGPMTVRSTNR
jgi:GntR family transcriptional regulator